MRKGNGLILLISVGSLLIVTCMTALHFSLFRMVMSVLFLFGLVRIMPLCRGYEGLWLFSLTAMGSIPLNIKLIAYLLNSWFVLGNSVIAILTTIELYLCILAVEEIIIGVLGRIIWQRQCRLMFE
ncbi:MAG: hypothetical protein IKY23_10335 [Lachnospiraceae bacterium]|nr:hypothetical protein [Lachnospiraceae bacterium]